MRSYSAAFAGAVLGFGVWGCSTSSNTSGLSTPSPVSGTALTIDVVAVKGSQSFSLNPSSR